MVSQVETIEGVAEEEGGACFEKRSRCVIA